MKQFRPVIISPFIRQSLVCIRSWGRQGFKVGMICVHNSSDPHPASRYLDDYVLLSEDDLFKESGITIIANFLDLFQADGLINMGFIYMHEKIACWLHDNKHKFPAKAALLLPSKDVMLKILSKESQIQAAREAGLSVLPTYLRFLDV